MPRKLILLLVWFLFLPAVTFANFSFENTPLKNVILTIQAETDYFFLYRESQVADIRVTINSSQDSIIEDLRLYLLVYNIDVKFDEDRNQVLLIKSQPESPPSRVIPIKGQIIDAQTGERLPFATISWRLNNRLDGVSASQSGNFSFRIDTENQEIDLSVSYIGYQTRSVTIDLEGTNSVDDLTVRLIPEIMQGREILVTAFTGYQPSDTLLAGMIDASRFSPLGESNSIRALQAHPSVSKGTALNNGINIRGSTPDGFLVLLDGMSIFNQSHLFGLLDSFNSDAIQASGYYFGVTPANIDTPTGGTLNLITKTGSLNNFKKQVGLSNTSINATLQGPINNRTSVLFSGRASYIDQLSWFNNSNLIQWGLDVDRPNNSTSNETDFTGLVLQPGPISANFYDIHAKIYYESRSSGRFIVSGYAGGDETSQISDRRMRTAGNQGEFNFEEVSTSNDWGNVLLSLKYEQQLFDNFYSATTAGFSFYQSDFAKDDFVYTRISSGNGSETTTIFTYPFQNKSSMNEFKVNQNVDFNFRHLSGAVGASWRFYRGQYSEASFDRPSYFISNEAHLADTYLQLNWNYNNFFQIQSGVRVHYYSPTEQISASPGVKARLNVLDSISFFGGYSVTQQFLHRVSIKNTTTSDVWVLSTENQPPANANQYVAGFEIAPSPLFYLKSEAYIKEYENLRFHELNTEGLENTFSGSPWYFQNNGKARGIETTLRNRFNRVTLTQTYTISEMIFNNEFLFDGQDFFADWDRTHSYNAVVETKIQNNLSLFVSWILMSGSPNTLNFSNTLSDERLSSYNRVDATLRYQRELTPSSAIDVSFSVFNLLNRDNVWYRTYSFNFDDTRSIPRLQPLEVDVLDLGFHPSFSISYSF